MGNYASLPSLNLQALQAPEFRSCHSRPQIRDSDSLYHSGTAPRSYAAAKRRLYVEGLKHWEPLEQKDMCIALTPPVLGAKNLVHAGAGHPQQSLVNMVLGADCLNRGEGWFRLSLDEGSEQRPTAKGPEIHAHPLVEYLQGVARKDVDSSTTASCHRLQDRP